MHVCLCIVSYSIRYIYWHLRVVCWICLLSRVCVRVLWDEWEMSDLCLRTLDYCPFPSFHLLVMWSFLMFCIWVDQHSFVSIFASFYPHYFSYSISFGLLSFLLLHWYTFQIWYLLHITLTYLVNHLKFLYFILLTSIFILDIFRSMVHEIFYKYCILCIRV